MRLLSLVISSLALSAFARPNLQEQRRQSDSSSLLIDHPGLPRLPSERQAFRTAAAGINLDNIQADILVGMQKNKELFYFFKINDKDAFKSSLSQIHPLITSTTKLIQTQNDPSANALNVAFSQSGLNFLGITDDLKDDLFKNGQFADAAALGDPGTGNWVDAFKGTNIHGVFLVAAGTDDGVSALLSQITTILGSSASELYRLQGAARPGEHAGHEHFGYLDGISQPYIQGSSLPQLPGQVPTQPGVFLLGEDGDGPTRPDWAKDGSFLAFRQLRQLVPEFDEFVTQNAFSVPGLSTQENADLFGARTVGRWKSGAPIDLAPLRDDPALGGDRNRNNDFNFTHDGFDLTTDQTHCPFSAHIRKTRPRSDFGTFVPNNQILRSGIPYGPEVTDQEKQQKTSSNSQDLERGLAFVAYQSDIGVGFHFMQVSWANSQFFLRGTGVDPIIGSLNTQTPDTPRVVTGLDPLDSTKSVTFQKDFVVSRGGEYFFSPSLSAIIDTIAK